jgi:hypothetical protein
VVSTKIAATTMAAEEVNSANKSRIAILASTGFRAVQNWRANVPTAAITKIVFLISSVIGRDAAFLALTCHVIIALKIADGALALETIRRSIRIAFWRDPERAEVQFSIDKNGAA